MRVLLECSFAFTARLRYRRSTSRGCNQSEPYCKVPGVNIPSRYGFVLLAVVLVVLARHEAVAQETSSFQELRAVVHVGDEVRITEVSGAATQGKLVTLSDSS